MGLFLGIASEFQRIWECLKFNDRGSAGNIEKLFCQILSLVSNVLVVLIATLLVTSGLDNRKILELNACYQTILFCCRNNRLSA